MVDGGETRLTASELAAKEIHEVLRITRHQLGGLALLLGSRHHGGNPISEDEFAEFAKARWPLTEFSPDPANIAREHHRLFYRLMELLSGNNNT